MTKQCLKEARLLLVLTVIAAVFSSFSLSLIPLTSGIEEGKSNIIAYAIAITFWLGLVLMLAATQLTKRKLFRLRETVINKEFIRKRQLPGIISFAFNWKNIVLYAVTMLGVVLIITDILFSYVPEKIMFLVISLTILSFAVHCVIDGKCYKIYKLIKESVKNETNH